VPPPRALAGNFASLNSSLTGPISAMNLLGALTADAGQPRVKYLSFEHDLWPRAAAIALGLQRMGRDYAVSPDWSFMFDSAHAIDITPALEQNQVALWKVRSPNEAGAGWISYAPATVDPAGEEMLFSGSAANAAKFVVTGWDVSTGPFSLSTAKRALLYFAPLPAPSTVQIEMEIFSEQFSVHKTQRMDIAFNGEKLASIEVSHAGLVRVLVPSQLWNKRPTATLGFQFLDAISPLEAGLSTDARTIGCGFVRIRFRPGPSSDDIRDDR
jgi:hypothetical protein